MKNRFLKISKWILYAFIITLIAFLLCMFSMGNQEIYEIPKWIGLPFFVSMVASLVVGVIAYVMCIVEKIKTKDTQFWKSYFVGFVLIGVGYTFVKWGQQDFLTTWIGAAFSISAVKAGEYIFEKRD